MNEMPTEYVVNMITNCAKMEAALNLLKNKIVAYNGTGYALLGTKELNEVLVVAGFAPIEIIKDPAVAE